MTTSSSGSGAETSVKSEEREQMRRIFSFLKDFIETSSYVYLKLFGRKFDTFLLLVFDFRKTEDTFTHIDEEVNEEPGEILKNSNIKILAQ